MATYFGKLEGVLFNDLIAVRLEATVADTDSGVKKDVITRMLRKIDTIKSFVVMAEGKPLFAVTEPKDSKADDDGNYPFEIQNYNEKGKPGAVEAKKYANWVECLGSELEAVPTLKESKEAWELNQAIAAAEATQKAAAEKLAALMAKKNAKPAAK